MSDLTYSVTAQASLDVQACVLPRAQWETSTSYDGRVSIRPEKGTWYGHVVRGTAAHDVVAIPMLDCPSCGKLLMLSHTEDAAKAIGRLFKVPSFRPVHKVNHLGKVSPDIRCMHPGCSFHRTVYLDRWLKTKPLYACAYIRTGGKRIEIDYSHAIDRKEALFHMGFKKGEVKVIATGPAVGFFVDERTGRITAEG